MVSEADTPENRLACYRVLQAHAEKVGERQYSLQLQSHLKAGRKKSTFKWKPTSVLKKLIKMSSDVLGKRITPKEAMSYIAHDYNFKKERYG